MSRDRRTVIDLFCGTGGFAHGFVNSRKRFELLYAIDLDPVAAATASANHSRCLVETSDIRRIQPHDVAAKIGTTSVDVVVGGPPCQGFSSLRPNRSSKHNDDRNDLYLEFARFVAFFRPSVAVLENVVGLLTHDQGNTLDRLLRRFHRLGYNVDWRLLNAASFGVPQKRERFVMIAARDNGAILFPKPTHSFSGRVIGYRNRERQLVADSKCPRALTVNDAIGDLPPISRGEESTRYTRGPRNAYQKARRNTARTLTLHKASMHNEKMMEIIRHAGGSISCIPRHLVTSGFSSCYSRLDGDEPSTTITVKFQSPASSKCIHPSQDRTITPREAARIQSFDDSFVFCGPLTQVARQIGNAVPPLLGQAIAGSVARMLD